MKTNPLLIGITGGIGAGKSVVCRVFHALGVSIYDADSRAKLLMTEDGELKSQITNLFGKDAFGVDGNLNNKLIVVTASKDIKINRILARDPHRDQAQVEAIMQKQLPDNQKIAKADYVLVNDGKDMLLPQILRLHQAFLSE